MRPGDCCGNHLLQDDRSPFLSVVEDTKREVPGNLLIRNDRIFRAACLHMQQPGSPEPGLLITFHDRDLNAPAHMITYRNQIRDGVIRVWNAEGQTTYWCQYFSGRKSGFCCGYQGGALRLVGDWDGAQLKQAVLLSEGKPHKSFKTRQEAEEDPVAAELLTAVGAIEKEIDTVEKLARSKFQQMKDDYEDDVRRKAVAKTTAQTRQRMLNRVKQNADDFQKAQKAMERTLNSGKP